MKWGDCKKGWFQTVPMKQLGQSVPGASIYWSWTRSQDPFARESKMQSWRQAATWSAYLAMWCINYSQWMLQSLSHFNYLNYSITVSYKKWLTREDAIEMSTRPWMEDLTSGRYPDWLLKILHTERARRLWGHLSFEVPSTPAKHPMMLSLAGAKKRCKFLLYFSYSSLPCEINR